MPNNVFKAKVTGKKIWYENQKYFEWTLLGFEGQDIDVVIRKHVEIRSLRQNDYYWAYLKIIERETGNEAKSLHEYFKRIFLAPRFIMVFGKEIKIPGSTTKLSKAEFSEYIKKIEVETGVPAPDPTKLELCQYP